MEIVIENPTTDPNVTSSAPPTTLASTTSPVNPIFATLPHRAYRTAYVTAEGVLSPGSDYYRTLQPQASRARHLSPEPLYETSVPIPTSVRRVDRSGLLEIAEPEPQRSTVRPRHSTGSETHPGGTLTRRIDRSGLLEAVPEVPDQCQSSWRTEKNSSQVAFPTTIDDTRSIAERKLTGAENDKRLDDQQNGRRQTSPRTSRIGNEQTSQLTTRRSSTETLISQEDNRESVRSVENRTAPSTSNPVTSNGVVGTSSVTSPYLRRYPGGSPTSNLERPTPVMLSSNDHETRLKNRNSFTCVSPSTTKFLPIDALPSRTRQSYVDLTGATYTRSPSATSPLGITRTSAESTQTNFSDLDNNTKRQQQPDCLGRLSPRSRGERQSPLTMASAIPDVIEAHGSRGHARDNNDGEKTPEGERAEAEGCEHTAIESLEERRVSFKAPNKILHNDNIQTLRVIILSEQL